MKNPVHVLRVIKSFLGIVKDPNRLANVFELNASIQKLATPDKRQFTLGLVMKNPVSAHAIQNRVRLGTIDLDRLSLLPANSLGGAYARFMKERGLSPESIPAFEEKDDVDYLVGHLYETHDLWHVITGMETDVPGELGLQAFYTTQLPTGLSPLLIAAGFLNAFLTIPFSFTKLDQILRSLAYGWSLGKSSQTLIGRDWKLMWELPLSEVRRALGIPVDSGVKEIAHLSPAQA